MDYSPVLNLVLNLVMKTLAYVSSLMWMQIPFGYTAVF